MFKLYARALAWTALSIALGVAIVVALGLAFGRPAAAYAPSGVSDQWSASRPFYQGAQTHRSARTSSRRSSFRARGWHGRSSAARHHAHSISLAGQPGPLIAKVQEIVRACGSRVISGDRPGARVAGSGRISNHARNTADDVAGNAHCIYAHLHGWPGGYSIDYARVGHVHISFDRSHEWGARFVHGGGTARYARRHIGRYYASVRHLRRHRHRYAWRA
jgi:hypothetical protein